MLEKNELTRAYQLLCAALRIADELDLGMVGVRIAAALDEMESSAAERGADLARLRRDGEKGAALLP